MQHNLIKFCNSAKNILFLQGPNGHFFRLFANFLSKNKKNVFKINFNGGDLFFYPLKVKNTYNYQGKLSDFYNYLSDFVDKHNIDSIVVFGDCRKYHQIAKKYCINNPQTKLYVFEEGYLRPNFITFEQDGVNDFSPIPKNAKYFQDVQTDLNFIKKEINVDIRIYPMYFYSALYYFFMFYHRSKFKNYQHHRPKSCWRYFFEYSYGLAKRFFYYLPDRNLKRKIEKEILSNFFVFTLQVRTDAQISVHSDFNNVTDALKRVLDSFSAYAKKNQDVKLIIKPHPFDRSSFIYLKIIYQFIKKNPHLKKRIYFPYALKMPIFLEKMNGLVTVNSTTGLSAIIHNKAVKCLGRANYNFSPLTNSCSLDEFWEFCQKPDENLAKKYRNYHLAYTQINCNFYSKYSIRHMFNLIGNCKQENNPKINN